MRLGARIQAAIEVLEDISKRHQPASVALADWGKSHRFAGSGDRSAIGTIVYDALRRRSQIAHQMKAETPRALAIGASPSAFDVPVDDIIAAVDGSKHAPAALTDEEQACLQSAPADDAVPAHVAGNFPAWLKPSLERAFGENVVEEGQALAQRAPVDLRVNTLLSTQSDVMTALERFGPTPTEFSPIGVRIAPPPGVKRQANVEVDAAHGKGWFEVQDEGSQITAMLLGAKPGDRVLDFCAGAGGKTLALAAEMDNQGELAAYDAKAVQLRPIFDRIKRAEATNVDVLSPGNDEALKKSGVLFDRVLVDAPCTGSGTWRRRPDTKWRLKPKNIQQRQKEQRTALSTAVELVAPGGVLVYATCSVLPEENIDQVDWLLKTFSDYEVIPYAEQWRACLPGEVPVSADGNEKTLQLTPARHNTDGFFIAVLRRRA